MLLLKDDPAARNGSAKAATRKAYHALLSKSSPIEFFTWNTIDYVEH